MLQGRQRDHHFTDDNTKAQIEKKECSLLPRIVPELYITAIYFYFGLYLPSIFFDFFYLFTSETGRVMVREIEHQWA